MKLGYISLAVILDLFQVDGKNIFKSKFSLPWKNQASVSTVCASDSLGKRYCSSKDCKSNEIILCLGNSLGFVLNCTDPYPFCTEKITGEAECAATNSLCSSGFFCTGEGIFPDPLDCKKFHFCKQSSNGLGSISYTCPNRYVFDPDLPTMNYCRYTNNFYCTLPKCGNVLKNVLFSYPFYPFNRQYVALCIPNDKPIVFNCPDGYSADLSTIPVTCNFKCKTPGLYPYPGNSTLFYECYYNQQNRLDSRIGSCFEGYVFVNNRCQPEPPTAPTESTTNIPITATEATTMTSIGTTLTGSRSTESSIPTTESPYHFSTIKPASSTQDTVVTTIGSTVSDESITLESTISIELSTVQSTTNIEATTTTLVTAQTDTTIETTDEVTTTTECISPPC